MRDDFNSDIKEWKNRVQGKVKECVEQTFDTNKALWKQEMKEELMKELRMELKEQLKTELRSEITKELKEEIKNEILLEWKKDQVVQSIENKSQGNVYACKKQLKTTEYYRRSAKTISTYAFHR